MVSTIAVTPGWTAERAVRHNAAKSKGAEAAYRLFLRLQLMRFAIMVRACEWCWTLPVLEAQHYTGPHPVITQVPCPLCQAKRLLRLID